jgi:hypothetical protein
MQQLRGVTVATKPSLNFKPVVGALKALHTASKRAEAEVRDVEKRAAAKQRPFR